MYSRGVPAAVDRARLAAGRPKRRQDRKRRRRLGRVLPRRLCRVDTWSGAGCRGRAARVPGRPSRGVAGGCDVGAARPLVANLLVVGRGPAVVRDQAGARRIPGDCVFRHAAGRGRGAHTDRRVPRPGHRVAHDGRLPPGGHGRAPRERRRRRAPQTSQLLPVELRQQRRAEQLEDRGGRHVRRVRAAHGHRGRAPGLQRGGRVADQVLVSVGVRPAVPEPVHRVHVLLRFRQLLLQFGLHRFFQGATRDPPPPKHPVFDTTIHTEQTYFILRNRHHMANIISFLSNNLSFPPPQILTALRFSPLKISLVSLKNLVV